MRFRVRKEAYYFAIAFLIKPITDITTPPPTRPPPTELRILIGSIEPLLAADAAAGETIPMILAPKPPPAIPATEFQRVPSEEPLSNEPATLPPTAPLIRPMIVDNIINFLLISEIR